MNTILVAAVVILSSPPVRGVTDAQENERSRVVKIDSILRLQDLRAPIGRGVGAFLSDADPVVRTRAVLACGSLQDTAAVGLLSAALADADTGVAFAAAFALGQTGTRLSEQGRAALEREIIRNRLAGSSAAGRMIEEIGKFGTRAGLDSLLLLSQAGGSFRHDADLIMSVARFAIRGITGPEAVRYLLRFVKPGGRTTWQVVYALQRTGDNQETRLALGSLSLLDHADDPLVRLNLAVLLGKFRGLHEAGGILQRMAGTDTDWRVRVNALKGLGQPSWKVDPGVMAIFRRSFIDTNLHVALTALSAFPATGVGARDTGSEVAETLRILSRLAVNASGEFPWQVQAEAAVALAKIDSVVPRAINSPAGGRLPRYLMSRLLVAAGESGDTSAGKILSAAAAGSDPVIVCAALEGLASLARRRPGPRSFAESAVQQAILSLRSRDMAIISTAAGVLEDSMFRSPASVGPLLKALDSLRAPDDAETMQDVIRTLGALRDIRAVGPLTTLLQCRDQSVAEASAAALGKITGNDYTAKIARGGNPLTSDLDMGHLTSLPHVVRLRLETSRGVIVIDLDRDAAPFTTMSIVKLSRRGFYRGLRFHRVVPNFVIQGGDPRGDGWGGPGYAIRSEFSPAPYGTGTVGIASAGKDTEGSQFFITHSPQPHLDGRYTVVGKVVEGMRVVDRIQVGDTIDDVRIVR